MQRIINDPTLVVEDMLQGFTKAYPQLVAKTDNPRVLKFAGAPVTNKVGIVTGGGSGHKPAFIGYIGKNLCDAVAIGKSSLHPLLKHFWTPSKQPTAAEGLLVFTEIMRGII
jgi:phosphoenolpyruvate---glycerone phosphotransferase subunit DhaK